MSTINYESREDCFAKCRHVQSRLVYGDLEEIPVPWITVLMPTYCRVDMLEEALNSVLAQKNVDFFWDIVVLDNEPDDGLENETERLIRHLDNKRILYYRNSENIRPGDNFNRGFLLARGTWVMMLHDDDLLVSNTLWTMGRLLQAYSHEKRPIGAIAASYVQVTYDPICKENKMDIKAKNAELCSQPINYWLYKITHNNVKVYSHIGGSVPTVGSTFLRKAVLDAGGFNEDFGISGDMILFYNLENEYNVYQTLSPVGFYRWGANGNSKRESAYRVVRDNFLFREYVYAKNWKNRLIGKLLRNCHYKKFGMAVVQERNGVNNQQWTLSDFDFIYDKRPNQLWYLFYQCVITRVYSIHKKYQSKAAAKRAERIVKM